MISAALTIPPTSFFILQNLFPTDHRQDLMKMASLSAQQPEWKVSINDMQATIFITVVENHTIDVYTEINDTSGGTGLIVRISPRI